MILELEIRKFTDIGVDAFRAYLIYSVCGWGERFSPLLLSTPPYVESKFSHELAGRPNFITNRGIMEAAYLLFFNHATQKPKRGSQAKRKAPGTLYRFIHVIQQLDVNYDLHSMTGSEIVSILPDEFREHKRLTK